MQSYRDDTARARQAQQVLQSTDVHAWTLDTLYDMAFQFSMHSALADSMEDAVCDRSHTNSRALGVQCRLLHFVFRRGI